MSIMKKINSLKMKQKEFIGVILFFSLLRLVLVAVMGVMPQDAYYSYYAAHPSLSYFDHPPMVAYMIWLFFAVCGKSALALHLGDFVVTSFTLWFFYLFLRQILHGEELKKAFLLVAATPFITILCVNTTPDVPLLFFWSLGLLLTSKAIITDNWKYWLIAGFVVGCAFTSKYTGLFFPFGLLLFMLLSNTHRHKIISWKSLLFVIMCIIAMAPVVVWNLQNDFISFRYQSSDRTSGMTQFQPVLFLGYLGSQLLLALPLLFLLLFRSTGSIASDWWKRRPIMQHRLFSATLTLPLFLLFTAIALIYWVKINWLMPVYLTGAVLTVVYVKSWKWLRWQTVFSILVHIAAFIELVWIPVPVNSDDTWWGWDKLAKEVLRMSQTHPDAFIFSDNSYKTAAALNFYLPQHVFAGNVIDEDAFQYALDDRDLSPLARKNALYVSSTLSQTKRASDNKIEDRLLHYFTHIQFMDTILLKDNSGSVRRKFVVYQCNNYHPPVTPKHLIPVKAKQ